MKVTLGYIGIMENTMGSTIQGFMVWHHEVLGFGASGSSGGKSHLAGSLDRQGHFLSMLMDPSAQQSYSP